MQLGIGVWEIGDLVCMISATSWLTWSKKNQRSNWVKRYAGVGSVKQPVRDQAVDRSSNAVSFPYSPGERLIRDSRRDDI